eukprot:6206855-Pleurochrysis_carterae.AAC.2
MQDVPLVGGGSVVSAVTAPSVDEALVLLRATAVRASPNRPPQVGGFQVGLASGARRRYGLPGQYVDRLELCSGARLEWADLVESHAARLNSVDAGASPGA